MLDARRKREISMCVSLLPSHTALLKSMPFEIAGYWHQSLRGTQARQGNSLLGTAQRTAGESRFRQSSNLLLNDAPSLVDAAAIANGANGVQFKTMIGQLAIEVHVVAMLRNPEVTPSLSCPSSYNPDADQAHGNPRSLSGELSFTLQVCYQLCETMRC